MIGTGGGAAAVDGQGVLDGNRRERRGDLTAVGRGVELIDGTGAADAARDVIPIALAADAEGRDDPNPRDGDPWAHGRSAHNHGVSIIRGQSAPARSAPAVSMSAMPSPISRALAVGGAIAFVLAGGAGIWLFVALGTAPAEGPLVPGTLVNAGLFGVFALHHSVLAREGLRARVARLVSPPLERPAYVWVASLLFIGLCLAWQPIAGTLYRVPPPWAWLLGALQLTGGLMTIDAARRIDLRVLSGLAVPPETPGPAPSVDDGQPLVAAGGYRLVRHPIYLGWVLLVWATPDMTMGRLIFAIVSTGYLVVAVPFEERSLRRRFGPSYDVYRAQVRWRIVPGIY